MFMGIAKNSRPDRAIDKCLTSEVQEEEVKKYLQATVTSISASQSNAWG